MIERIVITGDIFRVAPGFESQANQESNIVWLYHLLEGHLRRASGLPVSFQVWQHPVCDPITFSKALYGPYGLEPCEEHWAALVNAEVAAQDLLHLLKPQFEKALVIGFEIPPVLAAVLDALEIPYINMAFHPLRFLPDLMFSFASNALEVERQISEYRVAEEIVQAEAALFVANARRNAQPLPRQDFVSLLLLQVRRDRAMIEDGAFVAPERFIEKMRAQGLDGAFAIKPHPLDPENPLIGALLDTFAGSFVVPAELDAYQLVAGAYTGHMTTYSSGLGVEARTFGKPVAFLGYDPAQQGIAVLDAPLTTDFWRDVLSPLVATTPKSGVQLAARANRLRHSIGAKWSYPFA